MDINRAACIRDGFLCTPFSGLRKKSDVRVRVRVRVTNEDVRVSQSKQAFRMLLDRLGDSDSGKGSSESGIYHVPPVLAPLRAKPQVFDIAFIS